MQGDAFFAGSTTAQVSTDSSGQAGVTLTLGSSESSIIISCEARHNGTALQNAPLLFHATSVNRRIDPALSTLAVSPAAVVANGRDAATIHYAARDAQNNAVPGMPVTLAASGEANTLEQLATVTDQDGLVTATLRSIRAQLKRIQATANGAAASADTLSIRFIAGPAASFSKTSQDGTIRAKVGTLLPGAFAAALSDSFANPIYGAEVTAVIHAPDGSAQALSPQYTDSLGSAAFQWTLGPKAGSYRLSLAHSSLAPVEYSATALPGAAAILLKSGGDQQQGRAMSLLLLPLVVTVQDQFGNPVTNQPLFIQTSDPLARTKPENLVVSDSLGWASLTWQLGVMPEQKVEIIAPDLPGVWSLSMRSLFRTGCPRSLACRILP